MLAEFLSGDEKVEMAADQFRKLAEEIRPEGLFSSSSARNSLREHLRRKGFGKAGRVFDFEQDVKRGEAAFAAIARRDGQIV